MFIKEKGVLYRLWTEDGQTFKCILQGLSVPFACVGSSDPVRVLCLYTINTLDIL